MPQPDNNGKILIVDDDPAIRRIVVTALRNEGYQDVLTAADTATAKLLLRDARIDVVVTDLVMPEADGLALMEWAQTNSPGPSWIILSGQYEFEDALRAMKLGAFDFITKPLVELNSLVLAVRNAIRQKRLLEDHNRLTSELEARNAELSRHVLQLKDALVMLSEQSDRILQDLARAEVVQRALLPRSVPPLGFCSIDAFYQPSQKLGGDLYGVLPVDEHRIAFYIADAAGHGISAAMVAVLFKLGLQMRDEASGALLTPAQALAAISSSILGECTATGLFITAALCLLDTRDGSMSVASGGHPPLLIQRATGERLAIEHTGPALGMTARASYTVTTTVLNPGDRLLLYTDGILDPGTSSAGMSEKALQELLATPDSSRKDLLDHIVASVSGRLGADGPEDDITLVLITAGETGSSLNHVSRTAPARSAGEEGGRADTGGILAGSSSGCTVFSLEGQCRWAHAVVFHDACKTEIEARHRVLIDMADCEYLDSTFMGTIHELVLLARGLGVQISLQQVKPEVRTLLDELLMDDVLGAILEHPLPLPTHMAPLPQLPTAAERNRQRVLEAHEALASLGEDNRARFSGLIEGIRRESTPQD